MFVVFEGIDGSGKTTVSNRVAANLRERGIGVDHVRDGGEYASPLVRRMRELGKDTRNMAMSAVTELLWYVARDAQLLAENIRPALAGGGLVFADRYLYSYEVLSHFGRGLAMDSVRPILDTVADGLWPDLVVLMDTDPHVARARRRAHKIKKKASGAPSGGGSRKGLGGVGVQHRLRDGYRSLAESDRSTQWLVIDNSGCADADGDLDAVVERVTEAIAALMAGTPAAALARARTAVAAVQPKLPFQESLNRSRDAFYERIAARAVGEPGVAAYLIAGLEESRAHEWRHRLASDAPHVVAYGLRGLGSDAAWQLRDSLVSRAPRFVARSLDGLRVAGPRADAMRKRLAEQQPAAVLATLDGDDSDAAWLLREKLAALNPRDVLTSVKKIDSERAWNLRDAYARAHGAAVLTDPMLARPLAHSLRGIGGERAWQLRHRLFEAASVAALGSLAGLDDERAWSWRQQYASQAPKIIMRTFDGSDDPRAWELRRQFAPRVKEALDSMSGMNSEHSTGIRRECAAIWPSTVFSSLGPLLDEAQGEELGQELLAQNPNNLSLLKHATRAAARRERLRGVAIAS